MSGAKKPGLTFDLERSPRTKTELSGAAREARKQVGARITAGTYRRLKAHAAMKGDTVGDLIEQAITEFLANHP